MSFKYDSENNRIIHVNDEGPITATARIEPQWEDMLVICDNCGHAIHVKGDIRKPDVPDINVGEMICRQAAIDLLRKRLIETANNNVGFTCDAGQVFEDASEKIRYWIDELPAAEPERKTGKWIIDHLCSTSGGTYQVLRCSICEHSEPWLMGRNFCPNCGSDMRKEDNHE